MRILFINSVCGILGTGRICAEEAKRLEMAGNDVKIAYSRYFVPEEYKRYAHRIGNDLDILINAVETRLFDAAGFGCKGATRRFLKWADMYDPDILWLHNIHGYYIDIEQLFNWIKERPDMKVKWTLHDCWAFTGHCAHFTAVGCGKWKEKCFECPQKGRYPKSILLDNCTKNYARKKKAFTGVENMELITPSKWLAGLVKQSFLKEYAVSVQHNTIDNEIFKPTKSSFKKDYHIENRIVILGVANIWRKSKGLEDFYQLVQ